MPLQPGNFSPPVGVVGSGMKKIYIEGSAVSLMAHSFDGPKEMYDLHTVDINYIHCILHLSRESMNVFFGHFSYCKKR